MKAALLALVAAATAGCAAHRPAAPPADAERAELAAIVGRLRDAGVRVVVPRTDDPRRRDMVVDALDDVGMTAYRRVAEPAPGDVELRVAARARKQTWALRLWAWVLTLGLYPFDIDESRTYELTLARGDEVKTTDTCVSGGASRYGWLALAAPVSDEWDWGPDDDEAEARARRLRLGLCVLRSVDEFVRGAGRR